LIPSSCSDISLHEPAAPTYGEIVFFVDNDAIHGHREPSMNRGIYPPIIDKALHQRVKEKIKRAAGACTSCGPGTPRSITTA
jgi:hypothetical protein